MSEKIIRDPVHDVIAFQMDRPVDVLLFKLLSTNEFQRLRRVRQLGLASLAYPGADHSRYSHSLGVLATTRKILTQLKLAHTLHPPTESLTLIAALLHDIGHGPLSHVFERVSNSPHELQTLALIQNPQTQIHQTLAAHDPNLPNQLAHFLNPPPNQRTFYHDLIASQLDADRCDYLLRDNLHTGSKYGDFDLTWLTHAFTIDPASNRLAIHAKGLSALEGYLQSRYHMYKNVYFHKVVRSAEGMVRLALQRARLLAIQQRLPYPPPTHPLHKSLTGQSLPADEFLTLDDSSILESFKSWSTGHDPTLARLSHGLLFRKLYKSLDLTHIPPNQLPHLQQQMTTALSTLGHDPNYDFFFDEGPNESTQTPYDNFPAPPTDPHPILVLTPAGPIDLTTLSPTLQSQNQNLRFARLHVHEPLRPQAQQILQSFHP